MAVEAFAPAKVNLTLHVIGQRADGYHLLDSLVVFVGMGDRVVARSAADLRLSINGPMAASLSAGDDNLVLRAARFLGGGGAAITLTKHLPVASGIGGGSSDAAAALRALCQLWHRPLPEAATTVALGADVPVCLGARSRRMRGIGDVLDDVSSLPPVWLVLVNPGVQVPTAAVFADLADKSGSSMPPDLPRFTDAAALAAFLSAQRNDLEAPARRIAPEVGHVLEALAAQKGCLLARMSGSGATCFGLFSGPVPAKAAARDILRSNQGWWVAAAPILG